MVSFNAAQITTRIRQTRDHLQRKDGPLLTIPLLTTYFVTVAKWYPKIPYTPMLYKCTAARTTRRTS
jgi:hypothetical protein